MVVFGKSAVLFVQKSLYSGKSGSIRAKVVVLGQKWLYLGNVVVFGQKCS